MAAVPVLDFASFVIWICFEFRVSDFGFLSWDAGILTHYSLLAEEMRT
jgi:hypothetical protein